MFSTFSPLIWCALFGNHDKGQRLKGHSPSPDGLPESSQPYEAHRQIIAKPV